MPETVKPDGLLQLKIRRVILIAESARLRLMRRSKEASACEVELRAVTLAVMRNEGLTNG